jgi:hypothetical protein
MLKKILLITFDFLMYEESIYNIILFNTMMLLFSIALFYSHLSRKMFDCKHYHQKIIHINSKMIDGR